MASRAEVRPFESLVEHERMVDYFLDGGEAFQRGMGVDPAKLPKRQVWIDAVWLDHARPDAEKERFYLAWLHDGEQVGHSSISHIEPGVQAHVHLHLWRPDLRRSGLGATFLALSLDRHFERFDLARLLSEPFADNPAPNRLLEKLGFSSATAPSPPRSPSSRRSIAGS